MKNLIKLLTIAFIAIAMLLMASCPDGEKEGRLSFELINNGTAYRVRKGTVKSGVVNIPARHSASARSTEDSFLPVLEIGSPEDGESDGAFRGTLITEVIIPEGIESIYSSGFADCIELTSVTLPESLTRISGQAFAYNPKLESITIPANVEIIDVAAFRMSGLTSVSISEGVKRIEELAFDQCKNIESITIPASVEFIGNGVFFGWTSQQTIIIEGHANQESVDEAWAIAWKMNCHAKIEYKGN